jgi:hypothetical protein
LVLRVSGHATPFELLRDLANRAAQIAGLDETTSVSVAQTVEQAARRTLVEGSELELRLEDRGPELVVEIEDCGIGPEGPGRAGPAAVSDSIAESGDGVMDSVTLEKTSRGTVCRLIKRKPREPTDRR